MSKTQKGIKMPETKFSSERILIAFVDDLITKKYGADIDRARREELRAELYEKLNNQVQQAAIEALPDEKLVELETILNRNGTEEELAAFFETVKDVDTRKTTERAVEKFKNELLGDDRATEVTEMVETVEERPVEAQPMEVRPPEGAPVQGLTSDVQGQADVEGRNNG